MYRLKVNALLIAFGLARRIFGVSVPPAPTVCAIIPKGKKILVIRSSYREGYALPGGYLKGNESFNNGLKREVKEETSLKVIAMKYFNSYSSVSTVGNFPKVTVCFVARVKGNLKFSVEGEPLWIEPKMVLGKLVYKDNLMALKDYLIKK